MSLIDTSYFVGPLTIAQLGQPAVDDNLNYFINRYEGEFLQAVLGYELWDALMTGLSQTVVDQKWLDLRDGVAFTTKSNFPGFLPSFLYGPWYLNSARKVKWVGFASSTSFTANTVLGPQQVLTTGAGGNNPVTGQNVFTWAALAGATYWIERRGTGTLIEGTDFAFSNNKQTITLLKPGDLFGAGEIFILHFTQVIASSGGPSQIGVSPIAGYVYYKYMRDLVSQATGVGIVQSQSENSTNGGAKVKLVDAWNQMSKDLFILWQFLDAQGKTIYTDYDWTKINFPRFTPINAFDI